MLSPNRAELGWLKKKSRTKVNKIKLWLTQIMEDMKKTSVQQNNPQKLSQIQMLLPIIVSFCCCQ
jgi:hypothetical protein